MNALKTFGQQQHITHPAKALVEHETLTKAVSDLIKTLELN